MGRHTVFVPEDSAGTRQETAVLLVGTAREFGIHQRDIKSAHGGFWITDVLADVLYDEAAEPVEPEPESVPAVSTAQTKAKKSTTTKAKASTTSTTQTSGDRAAKNEPTEKE